MDYLAHVHAWYAERATRSQPEVFRAGGKYSFEKAFYVCHHHHHPRRCRVRKVNMVGAHVGAKCTSTGECSGVASDLGCTRLTPALGRAPLG